MAKRPEVKTLEKAAEAYFTDCDKQNAAGKIRKPYTLTGLKLALKLDDAEWEALESKKAYAPLFSRMKTRVEAFIEERMLTGELSVTAATGLLRAYFGDGGQENAAADVIRIIMDKETAALAE